MKVAQTQDIRDLISEKIKSQGRKLSWLAEQTNINYNTLYSILIHKTIKLSEENRDSINQALGTEF